MHGVTPLAVLTSVHGGTSTQSASVRDLGWMILLTATCLGFESGAVAVKANNKQKYQCTQCRVCRGQSAAALLAGHLMPEQQVGSDAGPEERAEDNTAEGNRDGSSGLVKPLPLLEAVYAKNSFDLGIACTPIAEGGEDCEIHRLGGWEGDSQIHLRIAKELRDSSFSYFLHCLQNIIDMLQEAELPPFSDTVDSSWERHRAVLRLGIVLRKFTRQLEGRDKAFPHIYRIVLHLEVVVAVLQEHQLSRTQQNLLPHLD
ncbi:hypothetical protein EYF80_004283 [Liparis tanakae]|uniref:Uncharacterized protein n=1 Tax=Liparis tanakae TaxID=230148 RepID=A0A4Z2J665_9TELE|nr:hypothetical protein EYF80_004283 [Liparis tanakae]